MIAIADPRTPGAIRLPGIPELELVGDDSSLTLPPGPPRIIEMPGPWDPRGIRTTVVIVDLFCGAGGFTSGAVRALAELGIDAMMAAVNHWPVAIETHLRNHRFVRHFIEDVRAADPAAVIPGGKCHILLASPSCIWFSRARGGRPNSDQKRMDPNAVLRWAEVGDVDIVVLENVPEFKDWGPIGTNGKPIKARKGEHFRKWIRKFQKLGYTVEWKILTCADYGDVTSRKRFFLLARKDGQPIPWPAQTHSQTGFCARTGAPLPRWRAAAEIIDWSDRGTSIFNRRPRRTGLSAPRRRKGQRQHEQAKIARALAHNTLRRVLAGTDRYAGPWSEVFAGPIREEMEMVLLDETGIDRPERRATFTYRWTPDGAKRVETDEARVVFHPGELIDTPRGGEFLHRADPLPHPYLVMFYGTNTARSVLRPMPTITAGAPHVGIVTASVASAAAAYTCANRTGNAPRDAQQPIAPAVTGHGGGLWVARPEVGAYVLGQQSCSAPRSTDSPIPAVSTAGAISLSVPNLIVMKGRSTVAPIGAPVPGLTAHAAHLGLALPYLLSVNHADGGGSIACRVRALSDPLQALTARRGVALGQPLVAGASLTAPDPYLTVYYGSNTDNGGSTLHLARALGAVTTKGRFGLCVPTIPPYLVPFFGERSGQPPRTHTLDVPAPSVTSHGAGGLVVPVLVRFDNSGDQSPGVRSTDGPIWTVTGKAGIGILESYIISPRHSRAGAGPAPRHASLPIPTLTGGGSQVGVVTAAAGACLVSRFGARPGNDRVRSPQLPFPTIVGRGAGYLSLPLVEAETTSAPFAGRIVWVDGVMVVIDLLFRMLRNGELSKSHSFDDETCQYEFAGNAQQITRQIGNSVPVRTAKALVMSQILSLKAVTDLMNRRAAVAALADNSTVAAA